VPGKSCCTHSTLPRRDRGIQLRSAPISPQALAGLSPSLRAAYIEAFVASLSMAFLVAAIVAFFGLVVSLLLPERPLRETIAWAESDIGGDIAQTFAMPTDTDSREQLLRARA
jgi:hypothetical protein